MVARRVEVGLTKKKAQDHPVRFAHAESRRVLMSLGALPSAVVELALNAAGWEHGWRLEVAAPALRDLVAEVARTRLGRCKWTEGSGRGAVEFAPSARHVVAAERRGVYVIRGFGADNAGGPQYVFFAEEIHFATSFAAFSADFTEYISREISHARLDTRERATKFHVEHVPGSADGRLFIPDWRSTGRRELCLGIQEHAWFHHALALGPELGSIDPFGLIDDVHFQLHLESRVSHLAFRRATFTQGDGQRVTKRALGIIDEYWNAATQQTNRRAPITVSSWELVPANLAPDEKFEFRVPA